MKIRKHWSSSLKKEMLVQALFFALFYAYTTIYVAHEGIEISETLLLDLVFMCYKIALVLLIAYVWLPRFFYKKRYGLFFLLSLSSILLFGVVEETVLEKVLAPETKGQNDLTWQSLYWYFEEVLIPLLTCVFIKIAHDNFRKQRLLDQVAKNKLENELQLLKSQMQPHILFNSLNNLYHFALEKSDRTPRIVLMLSNVLRYVLYEANDDCVPLEKELSFVEDYVDLQRLQWQDRGEIQLKLQNTKSAEKQEIAPFLLIPFVENSFKHSFGTQLYDAFVTICLRVEHNRLYLEIENNHEKEAPSSNMPMVGGIGLENVKKRLKLLYPERHELIINEQENRFYVSLTIHLDSA